MKEKKIKKKKNIFIYIYNIIVNNMNAIEKKIILMN